MKLGGGGKQWDCFIVFLVGEATYAEEPLVPLTCMVKGWSKLDFSTNQKGFETADLINFS